jgi:hypothetical protein
MTRLIGTIIQQGVDACRNLDVEARDKDFTLLARGKLANVFPRLKRANRLTFVVPGEARFTINTEKSSDMQSVARQALEQLQAFARRHGSSEVNADDSGGVEIESVPVANQGMQLKPRSPWTVRLFSGNPLLDPDLQVNELSEDDFTNGWAKLGRCSDFRIVQLFQPETPGLNVVIAPDTPVDLEIKRLKGTGGLARHVVKVHLAEPGAEQLLSLRSYGYYELVAATASSTSDERLAELLHENYGAALVYCYARIRAIHTRRLEKLLAAPGPFSNRTDICVLRGELDARKGHHKSAIANFKAALAGGLPCATVGLNTLIDRIAFYSDSAGAGNDDPLADAIGDLHERQLPLISRLRRFAHYCDLSQPIVQYSGTDPAQPNDTPAHEP